MTQLDPQAHVSEQECADGLRRMVTEAAFSSGATALTTGVILTALALQLGATNLMIGALASAPFLAQLLQGPGIVLVEKWRARKRIAVLSSIIGRSMLALMGLAVFLPQQIALMLLLLAQIILCAMSAFGSCAWNAWVRDLAPESRLGHVFARRTMWTSGVSLAASLAAGFALDRTAPGTPGRTIAFALLYAIGCITGLISAVIVARIPEPVMPPRGDQPISLIRLLRAPVANPNFLRLMRFLASWQFAVNLATPFFTVFIVRQLGFAMSFVVLLNVVSQIANLAALRTWGAFTDRFTNKSVLLVTAPAYILCIVAMMGASQIAHRDTVAAYLVLLHVLMGASVAGVTLGTTNIALKLSPKGEATAYVAASALASSLAAGLAPIIGGAFADVFASRRLELLLRWTSPNGVVLLSPLQLSHWDFYFLFAGLLGLYALHRLSLVSEAGEIERRELIRHLFEHTRRGARNLSTVAGLRALTDFPATFGRDLRVRERWGRLRGEHVPE
jgi:MFS family permease